MSTTLKFKGKAWTNFLETETAPQTKEIYTGWVRAFMAYCKVKDPEKLLTLGTLQETEDHIIAWLGTLKDAGRATATMKTALANILSWPKHGSMETPPIRSRFPEDKDRGNLVR